MNNVNYVLSFITQILLNYNYDIKLTILYRTIKIFHQLSVISSEGNQDRVYIVVSETLSKERD